MPPPYPTDPWPSGRLTPGGRLDEFGQATLWQGFERWLSSRFPAATRIFTDDAEPGEDTSENRAFLRGLGYEHVTGTHRIFAKGV